MIDHTHDPKRISWVETANGHMNFPIQNLPFGIFSPVNDMPRAGVAIGDYILDLKAAASMLPAPGNTTLASTTLNALLALPSADRRNLRWRLSDLLSDSQYRPIMEPLLHQAAACSLHLPAAIGDYTDFYAGIHHATNVGRQFRPDQPLMPNYKYVPIGYHGRASSVRSSGTPVIRPNGQRKSADADVPSFGPSRRLDYELELGIWIGQGNALGESLPIAKVANHIAGFCLLNDWSARDLQAWEYQPLGPFLAKSFLTTVSPWVVTAEALAPFRIAQPQRPEGDPQPLPYLWNDADQSNGAFALDLEVGLLTPQMRTADMAAHRLSCGSASALYWTVAQLVTHHASNGCNLSAGDLLGTGTISSQTPGGYGSLLEITAGGKSPLTLPSGETRSFLEDGDEIIFTAKAFAENRISIGFGRCSGLVQSANPI